MTTRTLHTYLVAILLGSSVGLASCERHEHEEEHAHEAEGEAHAEGEAPAEAGAQADDDSTTISAAAAQSAGIETAAVAAGTIRETLAVYGVVIADPQGMREIRARFPGVVVNVSAALGQRVARGAALATIESNDSLQKYSVTAPIAGQVLARDVNAGDTVSDGVLFTVGDLSSVWAEFSLFRRDLAQVRVGQSVAIAAESADRKASGKVVYIQPVGTSSNQSVAVRVSLDNSKGEWPPGAFVTGHIAVAEKSVPRVVRAAALQTFEGRTVVFQREGERYRPLFVKTGSTDGEWTEILEGMEVGTEYVAAQSYIVKADLEKSGAAHAH